MKIKYFQKGGTLLDLNREYIINTANASGNYGDLRKMIEGDGSLYNLNAKQKYISNGGTEAGFDRMNQLADEVYSNFIKNNPVENPFTTPVQKAAPTFNAVNDDIVNQVIKGKFGNGQARIDALTAAGYDPKEVQRAVNAKFKPQATPTPAPTPAAPVLPAASNPSLPAPLTAEIPGYGLMYRDMYGFTPTPVVRSGYIGRQTEVTPAQTSTPVSTPVSQEVTPPTQSEQPRRMMEGRDYRQYRREFAKNQNFNFAPNLFGEFGDKREQWTDRATGRIVSDERLKQLGWNPYYKQGGSINFLQQGGALAYIQKLPKDQQQQLLQAFGQWAKQKGIDINLLLNDPNALDQALEQFMQEMQSQQAQRAEKGAKLQFIKSLRGICPEGEELTYMKKGGVMCPVCKKKAEAKEKINKKEYFKKSSKKGEDGMKAPLAKCGKKVIAKCGCKAK